MRCAVVWQAVLVAGLLAVGLRRLPGRWVNARYGLAVTALVAVVIAGLATRSVLEQLGRHAEPAAMGRAVVVPHANATEVVAIGREPREVASGSLPSTGGAAPSTGIEQVVGAADGASPTFWPSVLVVVWSVGVVVTLARALTGVVGLGRLIRAAEPLSR